MSLKLNLTSTLTQPNSVNLSPLALANILDHHLRRNLTQDRVFGTLLGTKLSSSSSSNNTTSSSTTTTTTTVEGGQGGQGEGEIVEVKASFGVPYEIKGRGEINIDMDHHKTLLDLYLKVNPKEVVVGWYATSPQLNSFSALIHNFYTSESTPSPAIHLTLDPITLEFITYTTTSIGTNSSSTSSTSSSSTKDNNSSSSLIFKPIESKIVVPESERSGLDLLTRNLTSISLPTISSPSSSNTDESIPTPLATLYNLLTQVTSMLDLVLQYVRSVQSGERIGDERVGRALMETVGSVKNATVTSHTSNATGGAVVGGETKGFEEDFNAHLADVLMVSYLANLVKTQTEISSRLNLLV